MTDYTKGPWKRSRQVARIEYITSNSGLVAQALTGYAADAQEAEANADLIAAAPEMYHALQAALAFFYNPTSFDAPSVERTYKAAIAKAEGRQS